MSVAGFDHVEVPTSQPEVMLAFYRALGFDAPTLEQWRALAQPFVAIQFGENKIEFHAPERWVRDAHTLKGRTARPGCAHFCFVWTGGLPALLERIAQAGAIIEAGPQERTGAGDGGRARGTSVHTRDPDGNLLEFIIYPPVPWLTSGP